MKSRLIFKYGVMGSAKSAELLLSAYQVRERGMTALLIKPSIDTRDISGQICSRVGLTENCLLVDKNESILEKINNIGNNIIDIDKLNFIYVDEAQFFTKEQITELSDIVDLCNVDVVCYGLRADFKGELFEGSKRLFELSDKIEEIKSTCECGCKAIMNARIDSEGNVLKEGEQVEIGGNDRYVPLCRKCWKNNRINFKNKKFDTIWQNNH